jgi:hypothetical protein
LTHLARDGAVAASTQNQALSALLFLYKEVFKEEIGWLGNVERAKKPVRLPAWMTCKELPGAGMGPTPDNMNKCLEAIS